MIYFLNVRSLEDLKSQYKTLALANHPDLGGDSEVMKAINNEYDQLFPCWKHRSADLSDETAASSRSEFYTQNGWKGENYNPRISLKEIACIIREYVKDVHNDYKFSVTTDYGSMTQSLHIAITEAPADVFAAESEKTGHIQSINYYTSHRGGRDKYILTAEASAVIDDVQKLVDSYNRDDSDGMIDYFDRHFYDHFDLGKWDKPYKIVPKVKRAPTYAEYETVEITKTRTYKAMEPQEIDAPAKLQPGDLFQLKKTFNYGCRRGFVYQIDRIYNGETIYAYRLGKGYKNVRKGNTTGNNFSAGSDRFKKWVDNGSISFVKLVEISKTEEYTSTVRRPKKKTGITAADKRESRAKAPQTSAEDYTIIPDIDTRDDSALWVLRFNRKLERDEYVAVAGVLKGIGGYYSKFKKGFIFRNDPSATVPQVLPF